MSDKIELTVKGMSCGHCEMAVKKALEAIDGVQSAQADHKAEKAVVEVSGNSVERDVLVDAVKKAGYEAA